MPSSRALLKPPKHIPKVFGIRKKGRASKQEKQVVAQIVAENPGPITPKQVTAIATLTNRTKDMVRKMVEEAKQNFVERAKDYVDIHHMATVAALADGDNETAIKSSQWAMEKISAEGVRILDKTAETSSVPKVQIGIMMGGVTPPPGTSVTVTPIPNE